MAWATNSQPNAPLHSHYQLKDAQMVETQLAKYQATLRRSTALRSQLSRSRPGLTSSQTTITWPLWQILKHLSQCPRRARMDQMLYANWTNNKLLALIGDVIARRQEIVAGFSKTLKHIRNIVFAHDSLNNFNWELNFCNCRFICNWS